MTRPHLETLLPVKVIGEDPGRQAGPGLLLYRWLKTADSALQGSSKSRSKIDQKAAKEKKLKWQGEKKLMFCSNSKYKIIKYSNEPIRRQCHICRKRYSNNGFNNERLQPGISAVTWLICAGTRKSFNYQVSSSNTHQQVSASHCPLMHFPFIWLVKRC